jgi:hypothetical protein
MRRLPERLKSLRGTLRADRPQHRRPQPEPGAKPASANWSEPVRRRYDELVLDMGDAVTTGDSGVLWLTAVALVEVEEHTATLQAEGSVYTTSGRRGMKRPHPSVQLRDAAWRRGLAGLRSLGLTPVDRNKVEVIAPPVFDVARYTR